ncbi:MAG: hypothetical protein ACOH2N_10835 [Devosia sp.]
MSQNSLPEGSVVLRLEFSIADAVQQRGLLSVLGTAIAAWWNRPRVPADLPDYLRADVGLPPLNVPRHWLDLPANPPPPGPLWRPGM